MTDLQILILTIFAGLFVLLGSYVIKFLKTSTLPNDHASTRRKDKEGSGKADLSESKPAVQQLQSSSSDSNSRQQSKKAVGKDRHHHEKSNFSHPWLVTSLKGHTGRILDFDLSPNGKYLATCSEDRTVLIWPLKHFTSKNHFPIRGNIQFDHADCIKWSPDGKAFLVHKCTSNQIEVYKFAKLEDGGGHSVSPLSLSFNTGYSSDADTICIDVASNGKFIMSCSSKTAMAIYDLKGEVLATVDTLQMQNYCAKISPNSRLVAASGFTPDVKVWEVKFSRSGDFEKRQKRAFELTGNASGVFGFAFNVDSTRMVTVSKDGTWKVFDVDIDYERGQDPALLHSGQHDIPKDIQQDAYSVNVTFSPDGKLIAVSCNRDIYIYGVSSKEKVAELASVHAELITGIMFDPEGKWLLSCGDKHARVFHNVPGFEQNIKDLRQELRVARNESARTRIEQQIGILQRNMNSIKAVQ